MIEIIKAAFAAGEVKTFLIQGEYLEILEAAYPIDVAMLDRSGAQLSTMRNAEASYYSRPGRYEVVQVTSSQMQTVRIFVGSGDAGTRKTSGDVSVIDGGKSRTLSNNSFIGWINNGALDANYSSVQLWNPVGSGKNLIVEQLSLSSITNDNYYIETEAVALPTVAAYSPVSKLIGADVVSVAQFRTNKQVGIAPGTFMKISGPINQQLIYLPRSPFILRPGYGLTAAAAGVNRDLSLIPEWFEETI